MEPANTSLYGAAPAVDSLLGNIGTSASLNALAQINASRDGSSQINPFPTTGDAISYATDSEAASNATIVQSALGSVSTSSILSAYYANASSASDGEPQINVTG